MTQGIPLTMDSFRQGMFARAVCAATAFLFTFVFYINPTSLAVADELGKDAQRQAAIVAVLENTPEKKLSYRLNKLRDKVVKQIPQARADRQRDRGLLARAKQKLMPDKPLSVADSNELKLLSQDIDDAYNNALANFQQEADQLPLATVAEATKALIKQRHAQALQHVTDHHRALHSQLTLLLGAEAPDKQQQALTTLNDLLKKESFGSTHTAATPEHLPWSTPEGTVREPVNNPKDLQAATGINPYAHYVQLAMGDSDATNMVLAEALAASLSQTRAAELAESLEVQLTPQIKALAASLKNNSTEIYAWVHNNIRYIPSYGSIQGAQYTLETKQGNAIDTASLLIALLRAAKIPAHYAYGTVEVPAEQVMNWVGGATTPEAAQQILGQGGIPVVGLLEGGKITSFRMEHVWVEAWVDYLPSRGMIEKQGDSWVPMDASFKQYDFTPGMNLKNAVAFDAQALVNNIQTKATVNTTEGWVQNVPQADIEQQLTHFQTQLKTYIEQQNPSATVGDVLGLQKITIIPPRPLAAGLPYSRIVTSQTFADMPDKLRHKFSYSLATQVNGYSDTTLISIQEPTVSLAGKTLALSFKPSTKADEDIIASLLPKPDANGQIDPSQLPKNLPGYLINLTAEFTANGQPLAQANAGTMGSELYETLGLWSPKEGWETSVNHPTAGEYRAIGLDLQGANPEQAARLKQQLEQTKTKLESQNQTQLASLTKHTLVGDLLYGTVFNYFALNDLQDQIAAQSSGIISYRLPSYGTFSTSLKAQYWYGLPRTVEFAGLSMDIDHFKTQRVAKNNDKQEAISFTQSTGARMSAMEHLVPEQMFSTAQNKAEGISAVKALAIASQQGQKIWTIDKNNLELALSKITLDPDVKTDIRNAVNAGKIATAHEAQINFNGWIGEGYILMDQSTGAAAYMIAGGGNGADTQFFKDTLNGAASLFDYLGLGVSLLAFFGGPGVVAAPFALAIGAAFATITVLDLLINCGSDIRGIGVAGTVAIAVLSMLFAVYAMMFVGLGLAVEVLIAEIMSLVFDVAGFSFSKGVGSLCDRGF